MDFFGVGPLEIAFVLIIALIVLGPNDMVKAGRTIGRFLRKLVTSPTWNAIQQTSRELRYLPNKLMREAGLEEIQESLKEIRKSTGEINLNETPVIPGEEDHRLADWITPPGATSSNLVDESDEEINVQLPPADLDEKQQIQKPE
jgi:hypothetical protein